MTPRWRIAWHGWMKVRPLYRLRTRPSRYGIPDASAKPAAAGAPVSGTGITRSASTGCSFASCIPIWRRASYRLRPSMYESGRAK